jgi:hypothetical protein
MANEKDAGQLKPATPMVTAAVAPGRTVVVDGRPQGPGTLVTLPAMEARSLMGLGFLLSQQRPAAAPETQAPKAFQGPNFHGPVGGVVKPS